MKQMILAAAAAFGLMSLAVASDAGPVHGKVVGGGGCAGCAAAAAPAGPTSWGGPAAAATACDCTECVREKKLGLNPLFKRLMFWKKDNECGQCDVKRLMAGCRKAGSACGLLGRGHPAGGFNPYPDGVPGTLVFPQHPYVRSPRDWYEK
jgi:hypothetical protein